MSYPKILLLRETKEYANVCLCNCLYQAFSSEKALDKILVFADSIL